MNIMLDHSLPHDSAHLHVHGTAKFVDDIPIAGVHYHCAPITSTINHGRIIKRDFSAIISHPDCVCVLTADDILGENDISPTGSKDEQCIATDIVHFYGQVVGLVVAKNRNSALALAKLAQLEYETLPAIIDVRTAMQNNNFVLPPRQLQIGSADNAMTQCTHKIQGELEFGGQEHFYLEGQVSLAVPEEDGNFTIYTSTQHPTEVQNLCAHFLHIPAHKIVVDMRRMGGGFGGKETQAAQWAMLALLASHKTGKPCKLRLDRDDDMQLTGKRHGGLWQYECGFDENGKIGAVIASVALDCGFSADLSGPICDRAMYHADNAYHYPNATIRALPCKTNKVSNTAFRGFGGPQGVLLAERMIEHIAQTLGREPMDIRKINYYPERDSPHAGQKTPYHQPVKDGVLHQMTNQIMGSAHYERVKNEVQEFNKNNQTKWRGMALTPVKFGISFTNTGMNQAGALVHIYTDGSVMVNHGGTEMGQGLMQKCRQITARCLGVTIDKVRITATNTAKVANTQPTAASAGTDLNGMAIKDACDKILTRIHAFVREKYNLAGEITINNNQVHFAGKTEGLAEICFAAHWARVQLWDSGFYKTPDIHFDPQTYRGEPFYYYAYGMAQCVVEVDILTGEYQTIAVDLLHDVGESLNPALDIGQITGGFVQGMGWLTAEELYWNNAGKCMTHAPSTYKIPTASDIPSHFNVALFKNSNMSPTIFRSKAVGEPPLMLGVAVFQALSQAVLTHRTANGKTPIFINAPATPERILLAIHKA